MTINKNKADVPVFLWAEVTHQMAGPEQRTCIGAKRCKEDSRSLHIALQSHKAHWDIHRRYVIGVPLKRQQKQIKKNNTERYDKQQASKLRDSMGKMCQTNKTCMMYVHAMGKS